MTPTIIDPIPRRIPNMQTIQDAAKLNIQECTTFYVSAYLFQVWISELSLANAAQMAEQPDPAQRSPLPGKSKIFQSGEAWRGFQKYFGKATDAEIPTIFGDLMEFGGCDDLLADHILRSAVPLSIEHEITGDFIGTHTPRLLANEPQRAIAVMRATIVRLCDWLDSELHLRLLREWHLMPDCFDPDPKKRELALLGINYRHFNRLSEQAKDRFITHAADVAAEHKNTPDWAAFRQTANNPAPPARPWPTEKLDTVIVRLWPLVKRYHWSASQLLGTLGKVLPAPDLSLCPNEVALVSYCNDTLNLRWNANSTLSASEAAGEASVKETKLGQGEVVPSIRNQNSKIKNQKSHQIALRLLHVGEDGEHQTKTE